MEQGIGEMGVPSVLVMDWDAWKQCPSMGQECKEMRVQGCQDWGPDFDQR